MRRDALKKREDMRFATVMTPSLAFEHLEHRDLFGGQGITLDGLQMLNFEAAFARGLID